MEILLTLGLSLSYTAWPKLKVESVCPCNIHDTFAISILCRLHQWSVGIIHNVENVNAAWHLTSSIRTYAGDIDIDLNNCHSNPLLQSGFHYLPFTSSSVQILSVHTLSHIWLPLKKVPDIVLLLSQMSQYRASLVSNVPIPCFFCLKCPHTVLHLSHMPQYCAHNLFQVLSFCLIIGILCSYYVP